MKSKKKGLGDVVHSTIKFVSPKLSEKYKDCNGCKKRRIYLNNIGAKFG